MVRTYAAPSRPCVCCGWWVSVFRGLRGCSLWVILGGMCPLHPPKYPPFTTPLHPLLRVFAGRLSAAHAPQARPPCDPRAPLGLAALAPRGRGRMPPCGGSTPSARALRAPLRAGTPLRGGHRACALRRRARFGRGVGVVTTPPDATQGCCSSLQQATFQGVARDSARRTR